MPVKSIIFSLADIPLSIKYTKNKCLLYPFKRFKANLKASAAAIWQLESLALEQNAQYPKAPERLSFYFNDPVQINLEKKKIRHFYLKENRVETFDPRLVAFAYSQILALKEGLLLHCAAVIKNKEAYLFFAPSNGGKSTVAELSKRYQVIGDDIIAVRKNKKDFFAYATPWKQAVFIRANSSSAAKIKAVFFLKKSDRLHFERLKPEEALIRVLCGHIHFFLYTERRLIKKLFFTAANFFKAIPAYEMYFRKEDNFWPMLEKKIK